MQAPIELLVESLYNRLNTEHSASVSPPPVYAIATDVAQSLSGVEQAQQLRRILAALAQSTGFATATTGSHAEAAGQHQQVTPFLVGTAAALLAMAVKDVAAPGEETQSILALWETAVLRLFAAHPPYEEAVLSAASFGAAQLITQCPDGGGCARVLEAACSALAPSTTVSVSRANQLEEEETIPVSSAVELLSQCASLLVTAQPVPWSGAEIAEASAAAYVTASLAAAASAGSTRGKPSNGAKRAAQQEIGSGGVSVAAMVAPQRENEADKKDRLRMCEWRGFVRERLVSCCLDALGPAASFHRDPLVPALLCRRVLIPLLLTASTEGEKTAPMKHEQAVYELIGSLAAAEDRRDDVVVLMAALFDFLFHHTDANPTHDFRFSELLWETVHGALWEALTADTDAGRRANMQARAEYLLKRVVYTTQEQEEQGDEEQEHSTEGKGKRGTAKIKKGSAKGVQDALIQAGGAGDGAQQRRKHAVLLPLGKVVRFHEWFEWTSGKSAQMWEHFFLVLETLNEYGWHIIQPVLRKLDALISALTESLEASSASATGAVHACWVELLLLKMIRHPNIGVRKVGLRRVWALPSSVLAVLSLRFLFTYVFSCSSDYHLCAEVDRTPLVTNFLASAGFEGSETLAVPNVQPLVQEVEQFYAHVFIDVLDTNESARDAWRLVMASVADQPPRYTVSVLLRVMHAIGTMALNKASPAGRQRVMGMALDPEALQIFSGILREFAQENAPYWLDVRLTAITFEALLLFACLDPATCSASPAFMRVLGLCGPLGQSGGRGHARMAAGAQYGFAGANIDQHLLQAKLVQVSKEQCAAVMTQSPPHQGVSSPTEGELLLLHGLLQSSTLESRTAALLQATEFDDVRVKQHFFLTGALLHSSEDARVMRSVCDLVASTVCSFRSRAAVALPAFLTALASLVEIQHALGASALAALMSLETLSAMSEAVHIHAKAALADAVEVAGLITSVEYYREPVWALMYTAAWDVVTAAIGSVNKLLAHSRGGAAGNPSGMLEWLVMLLRRCSSEYALGGDEDAAAAALTMAKQCGWMVIARNASRLLQCELSGFVVVASTTSVERDATDATVLLPVRVISEGGRIASSIAERAICSLTQCLVQRHTNSTAACPLSTHTWPTLLTQHFRGVYVAMYVLCHHLDLTTIDVNQDNNVLAVLTRYTLDQVEESWTSNLDCVYSQLSWLASLPAQLQDRYQNASSLSPLEEARLTIAQNMLEHTHDVGAKQHACLSFLALSTLCYTMPHHPEFFSKTLWNTLRGAQVCDRDVYFVSMAASLAVLRDPQGSWRELEGVLLEVAVMFNSGRDEEENDSTMSSTESIMLSWPRELRERYPPTVRLAMVGRALAVATILWKCAQDPELALDISLRLLDANVSDPLVTHEPCMPNSRTHRIRIRLWQLLCALLPLLPDTSMARRSVFEAHAAKCLTITNMGSVRRLMELYAIKLMEMQPSLYDVVAKTMADYNLRPQIYGSFVLISCHTLLRQETRAAEDPTRKEEPGMFAALFQRLIQQSTSNQHLLRIISHIGVYKVCCARVARGCAIPPEAGAIFDYVATAGEHVKLRAKHEATLFFDTEEACGARSIFCAQRKEANVLLHESIPAACFERIRFLEQEMACLIGATFPVEYLAIRSFCTALRVPQLLDVFREFEFIPHTRHRTDNFVDYTVEAMEFLAAEASGPGGVASEAVGEGSSAGEASDNIQKKVTPWWSSEVCNELHPRALQSTEKQSLVVVGSLLENPVNIAGLCRCGEIFAVEKIVVPHRKVFEHPHFVATARSAELWIPWEEVAPKELVNYLETKRRDGYCIIGIEQTASSVSMATYAFPKKAVVVLGAEGQGIPAPLIPLLDVCVEIPQFGLIRSLNVHVTGAVVMYEYTKQHLMSNPIAE